MIFHNLCILGSLPYFFPIASFYTWKGCVSSLFSYHLTGSLCWNDHLWLLLNLSLNYCLPRQPACLSLVLCKLVFSYLPVSVMGLWPGKSGLLNSNLSLSLFIYIVFHRLQQQKFYVILFTNEHTESWQKDPSPLASLLNVVVLTDDSQWSVFWD